MEGFWITDSISFQILCSDFPLVHRLLLAYCIFLGLYFSRLSSVLAYISVLWFLQVSFCGIVSYYNTSHFWFYWSPLFLLMTLAMVFYFIVSKDWLLVLLISPIVSLFVFIYLLSNLCCFLHSTNFELN